jgi:hypothetical protein
MDDLRSTLLDEFKGGRRGATDAWVTLRKQQIAQGELVSAAHEISAKLRKAHEYDDWLENSVGSLRIVRRGVLARAAERLAERCRRPSRGGRRVLTRP